MKLTIGMAHHNDFDGAYFSIQDIRKELIFGGREDLLKNIEFVVVDNDPDGDHAKTLNRLMRNGVTHYSDVKVINMDNNYGTSCTRNAVISNATGDWVLVMDCHVLLCPALAVIENIFNFMFEQEFMSNMFDHNLFSGPLVQDTMRFASTHFNDEWGGQMWGKWGSAWACKDCGSLFSPIKNGQNLEYVSMVEQQRIIKCVECDNDLPVIPFAQHKQALKKRGYGDLGMNGKNPFEIFSQGLGLFLTKRTTWLGFNEHARGFGGEEGYIHIKYRQAGRRAMCLPFLKWIHRFARPDGVKYPLTAENKARNYILEFTELGLDLNIVKENFSELNENMLAYFIEEANSIYGK